MAGQDLGTEEVPVPNVFGDSAGPEGDSGEPPAIIGDQLSLGVPVGARTAEGLACDQSTPLLYVSDPVPDKIAVQTGEFTADASNWFRGKTWLRDEVYAPDSRWLPPQVWESPADHQVLGLLARRMPRGFFGMSAEELSLEGVQPGSVREGHPIRSIDSIPRTFAGRFLTVAPMLVVIYRIVL